jgi:putative serine protease PepD
MPPEPPFPPDPNIPPQPPEQSASSGDWGRNDVWAAQTQIIEEPTLPFSPPYEPPTTPHPAAARERRFPTLLVVVALAAGLIGGGLGAGLTYAFGGGSQTVVSSLAQSGPVTPAGMSSGSNSVEQVAATVLPSVVSITVRTPSGVGEGSGIILSSDGLILTNNHVVQGAGGGQMAVTYNDGVTASASIVGTDPSSDLAVIRASGASNLRPATLGSSSNMSVGQPVVAIGSPLGLSGTVTSGIVSALNRPVRTGSATSDQSTVLDAIQTDAAINPGNSGGPLVDMQGRVVGINSAIATTSSGSGQAGSIGVGFAIPIDQARPIAEQLIADGHANHAVLGVQVKDALTNGGVTPGGAAVIAVTSGGPAGKAGLQVGDVIVQLDDRRIDTADSLVAAVRSHKAGETVQVTYLRNGAKDTVSVTLGSQGG